MEKETKSTRIKDIGNVVPVLLCKIKFALVSSKEKICLPLFMEKSDEDYR